ncbi:MAG: LysM peptidoglycan-binding domain-containing protein, partial [Anaerolineae bacterium]|nr:LysM peptidoglycan-binding domain-containing protein [Anaerolineae bacterium]
SVQPGDNLLVLAARLGTTPEEIQAGNCMEGETKLGETLYLPGEVEVETPPAATCGPPSGWSLYEVADGEDFVDLSRRYSVSEDLLREANCLGPANRLHSGMRIFVPAPPTPTRTEFAVTSFPTSTPTLSTPAPQETETPPNP